MLGYVLVWARGQALEEPEGSPRRRLLSGFYRGFVNAAPMWAAWKEQQLQRLPDEPGDDARYRSGMTAGEFLVTVMFALVSSFQHCDLSAMGPLLQFALHYGGSMSRDVGTGTGVGAGTGTGTAVHRSVLEWIRDSETMFRAHSAAAHDAESHCYGVGERIELEFLRALAKRTGVPLPPDAEALIAERRRDARNLPAGVDWSRLVEPVAIGGPRDGAGQISPEIAKTLGDRIRSAEWTAILDRDGDGAPFPRGILSGLAATDPVPVLCPPGTNLDFHRGRLCGSLEVAAALARREARIDLARAAYTYARVLVSAQAQALLREPPPDGVLKADALARLLVRRRLGHLDDADALAFFNWLAEQSGLPVTPALLERREHFVARQVNRTPDEPPSEG